MSFEECRQFPCEKEMMEEAKNLMQGLPENEVFIPAKSGWDFL